MSRTGYALGRLDPVIYFENSDGKLVLPPTTEDARWIYSTRYAKLGFEWKEAGTLAEVDQLQKRLIAVEAQEMNLHLANDDELRQRGLYREVGERLRARMVSAATTEYEKDFISAYLMLREEKRAKYAQLFLERTSYLWALEMDSKTKATDRMHSEPGDLWRNAAQQKV